MLTNNQCPNDNGSVDASETLSEIGVVRSRALVSEILQLDRELREDKQLQKRGIALATEDSGYLWLESKMSEINNAKSELAAAVEITKAMRWSWVKNEAEPLKYAMPQFVSMKSAKSRELFQGLMDFSYEVVSVSNFEEILMSGPLRQSRDNEDVSRIFSTARLAFASILGIDNTPLSTKQCRSLLLNVLRSLSTGNRKVGFVQIICPEIFPECLLEEDINKYAEYVARYPGDQARIASESSEKMVSVLRFWGIPSEGLVILADNDEEEYIYPVLQPRRPSEISYENSVREGFLNQLRKIVDGYKKVGISEFVKPMLMSDIPANVEFCYEETCARDIAAKEAPNVRGGLETYYKTVWGEVSDGDVAQIAYLKCLTYFKQAQTLKSLGFNILINGEVPVDVRERMYNLGLEPDDPKYLSVINPNAKK